MSRSIPSPELIGDSIEGAVYEVSGKHILVVGAPPASLVSLTPQVRGSLTARYALPLYNPPMEAIIPGLFAAETGGILVGREAWDYLQNNFQIHPRADVVGKRLDGADIQVFLREVDMGRPVRVLIFTAPEAVKVAVEVTGLVVGTGAPPIPDLLAQNLPMIRDLDASVR